MFFTKFIVSAIAIFGAAPSVFASPIAQPLFEVAKRGGSDPVYNTCQQLHDSCLPIIAGLTPIATVADIVAKVDVLAGLYATAKVDLLGLVDVDISADIDAIVDLNVDLIVKLIVALSTCHGISLSIFAQIDAFVSAYLSALAVVNADVVVSIGKGVPLLDLSLFVTLKLTLTATVLAIISII